MLGQGSAGVVLANESDLNLCAWLPFARALSRSGRQVLLFDYAGATPASEVAAAADELRALGATSLALVGASEGAKAAIMAAATRPGLADSLVALSPERYLQAKDVTPYARRLRLPVLFAVSRHDPFSASDTPRLERLAGSARKRLVVVPGSAHGVALLRGRNGTRIADAVEGFLPAG